MTAADGLRPVERLPEVNEGVVTKRQRIEELLAAFMAGGSNLAEVTVDSTGGELKQERIDAVRGYIYRVASEEGVSVGALVRKDHATGRRRLYLQRKESK